MSGGSDTAQKLADELEAAIINGQLPVGTLLPSEREISEKLKIGRGSIREAMNRLIALGLVRTHHRSGTRVEPASRRTLELGYQRLLHQAGTDLLQLNIVRLAVEPGIAELAAKHRTPEHLRRLKATQELLRKRNSSLSDLVTADLQFHTVLADATGNLLFDVLLVPIQKLLGENHVETFRRHGSTTTVREHQAIIDAVEAGDASKAAEAMRFHLNSVMEHVKQIMAEAPPTQQDGVTVWSLSSSFLNKTKPQNSETNPQE